MLSLVTEKFEVITVDVDERAAEIKMEEDGVPALKVSEGLAHLKAKAVFETLSDSEKENTVVIGADTSVVLDNVIFGKPADREEAIRMLSLLSGHTHVVATGVAILTGSETNIFTEETRVEFNPLDEQQTALIETGKEAGVYNNEKQAEADAYYRGLMEAEGVTVYEPTEEDLDTFRERAKAFYELGSEFGWSDGLYETVNAAMGK